MIALQPISCGLQNRGSRRASLVECTERLNQTPPGEMPQSGRTHMFADREMEVERYVTYVVAGNMAARPCSLFQEAFTPVPHSRAC
jgi:hypothetical protein